MTRRLLVALALLAAGCPMTQAAAPQAPLKVTVSGQADGKTPAWRLQAQAPPDWTQDCCQYARAIGVNEVVYQGEWSGEPDRVAVLNVWPAKLPTLNAELADDRANYLKRDPAGKVAEFALGPAKLTCRGVLYRGSDQMDDAVVFCDPAGRSGIRLSWSMSVKATDPQHDAVLAVLRGIAESTRYRAGAAPTGVH